MAENIKTYPNGFNWTVSIRLNPLVNQMIQRVAEPFRPSSQIPEWIWKRIPIVGTFPVEVTDNKAFLYRSIGEPAGKVLYWRGNWGFEEGAPQIFYKLAQTAQTFFDIGAYVGYYTLLAATANPNIQVFAFEPVPSINARLHEHIQMNHFHRNTTIEQVVLSDKVERTIPFYVPLHPWATSSSLVSDFKNDTSKETIFLESLTLDTYVEQENIQKVDLIKIDVEGAEVNVLRGASRTLNQHRPIIFCEILEQPDEVLQEIEGILLNANYRHAHITPKGLVKQQQIGPDLTRKDKNYLFWPAEQDEFIHSLARS